MSGGTEDFRAEDTLAINTESGVRIKTAVVRRGYVKGMTLKTMKYVLWMVGNSGSHPDNNYDLNALPVIDNINYRDIVAENVTMAGQFDGIPGDPFAGICISNITIDLAQEAKKYSGIALTFLGFQVVRLLSLVIDCQTREKATLQLVTSRQNIYL